MSILLFETNLLNFTWCFVRTSRGLSHSGEDGVYNVLKLLNDELALAMKLMGAVTISVSHITLHYIILISLNNISVSLFYHLYVFFTHHWKYMWNIYHIFTFFIVNIFFPFQHTFYLIYDLSVSLVNLTFCSSAFLIFKITGHQG